MTVSLDETTAKLKEKLLAGEFPQGMPLQEAAVADAIEVRAELEVRAVRLAAARGLSLGDGATLRALLDLAGGLLDTGMTEEPRRADWIGMNTSFHDIMIAASANRHSLPLMSNEESTIRLYEQGIASRRQPAPNRTRTL